MNFYKNMVYGPYYPPDRDGTTWVLTVQEAPFKEPTAYNIFISRIEAEKVGALTQEALHNLVNAKVEELLVG